MPNVSVPADIPRRCQRCGRGLAPHEESCEGCALAAASRAGLRASRRVIAIAALAAALEMVAAWWYFLPH